MCHNWPVCEGARKRDSSRNVDMSVDLAPGSCCLVAGDVRNVDECQRTSALDDGDILERAAHKIDPNLVVSEGAMYINNSYRLCRFHCNAYDDMSIKSRPHDVLKPTWLS